MSFSGKYQLESQENFEPFMKAIGLSDEIIQKIKALKSISEIEENGDTFKVTITTGSDVTVSNFTIGQEAELLLPTGEKVKAVIQREGSKLKTTLKNIVSVMELVDANTLISTLTIGNIVHKRTSKRI